VTQGPEVAAFEREFAAAVGAPHACAVSSCTTALHLALARGGRRPGDEVVTVSHSFIATANAIRYCGAVPVFVDVELDTFNIDPALVDAACRRAPRRCSWCISSACRAISRGSWPTARGRGVPVIEDAACADRQRDPLAGRVAADRPAARRHGVLLVPPAKLLSTGDGGMVVTASADADARCGCCGSTA
jgi:dTDP-4-amino-4,6-dideoxygalactose transaminase